MNLSGQVILRKADGTSILNATVPLTSRNVAEFYVEEERILETKQKLEQLGFFVGANDRMSLSITGTKEIFAQTFGIDEATITNSSENYSVHAVVIPEPLEEFISDVIITKSPEYFEENNENQPSSAEPRSRMPNLMMM
ncbi:hypothetical protein [Candidatus Electronema sp. JC]|uniref:hypothetical protein n=1 Tax=Candidatus Electronema sp. JC TaxID=3401570 RepID=UPI003B429E4C